MAQREVKHKSEGACLTAANNCVSDEYWKLAVPDLWSLCSEQKTGFLMSCLLSIRPKTKIIKWNKMISIKKLSFLSLQGARPDCFNVIYAAVILQRLVLWTRKSLYESQSSKNTIWEICSLWELSFKFVVVYMWRSTSLSSVHGILWQLWQAPAQPWS